MKNRKWKFFVLELLEIFFQAEALLVKHEQRGKILEVLIVSFFFLIETLALFFGKRQQISF
jgi:hypothetical protein